MLTDELFTRWVEPDQNGQLEMEALGIYDYSAVVGNPLLEADLYPLPHRIHQKNLRTVFQFPYWYYSFLHFDCFQ